MSLMPSCREVSTAVASGDLSRRPWGERLMMRLHLMMCRHCRRYAAQLAAIGAAARRVLKGEPPPSEALEQSILDSIRKR
jgi:anti-sigma factor ChrR (cupin superfamily)